MPELIEVEYYRRLAERALGRTIVDVDARDAWFLKRGTSAEQLRAVLPGRRATAARRVGKLLLVDLDDGTVLGLRFGMTGRLVVDGTWGIHELEYGSDRDEPAWDRFGLTFADGGHLAIRDPRRLGGVELDPDEDRAGPDASTVTAEQLATALDRSQAPLKARLMDQQRLAGLGNLLTDEICWRARLDPGRAASSIEPAEILDLAATVRATVADLLERGGSHTGDLQAGRRRGGTCPRCGAPLLRRQLGGRTTVSCPVEQPARASPADAPG